MTWLLFWPLLGAGCTPDPVASEECPCDRILLPADVVTDDTKLDDLLGTAALTAFPELEGLTLTVSAVDDLQFFRSTIDLDSLRDGEEAARVYRVEYDPVVLSDPPPVDALAAVLVHELGHVKDYTAMSVEDYVNFGLWYGSAGGTDELAAYERATDEQALNRGCAAGLSSMRDWIYAHCSGDVLTEKQRDYYSPDEIDEWTAENGVCASEYR